MRFAKPESLLSRGAYTWASIAPETLSNIERGITQNPPRATLTKILDGIDKVEPILPEDRNMVLEVYGYCNCFNAPTDQDIVHVREQWRREYCSIKYPAYLMDFTQRLLDWNRYAPLLIGMKYGDPSLERFRKITVFDLVFNPAYKAALRIVNGEDFFPQLLQTIKAEMVLYRNKVWYNDLIDQTTASYPQFGDAWHVLPDDLPPVCIRRRGSVHIKVQEGKILKFQSIGVDCASDPRFRIVQHIPLDGTTMREWWCWIGE